MQLWYFVITRHTRIKQKFHWKSKNYEVLSQLFNTLALSESQAELILIGASYIFQIQHRIVSKHVARLAKLTLQCRCRRPFLKSGKRSPECFRMRAWGFETCPIFRHLFHPRALECFAQVKTWNASRTIFGMLFRTCLRLQASLKLY